ncbi:MAG: nitroreductase family deazaflavin-dependent oxidoreductase [Actinomycetota bacterium]
MWRWIAMGAGGLVAVALGLWVFLLVAMRTGNDRALGVIRRFNRRFMNRRAMKTAGTPGAYASIIRHVGRKSGKPYETPVGVVEAEDGFLITLPYGRNADWLKNVEAAGSAALVHEGRTIPVSSPRVIPARELGRSASRWERFVEGLYRVDLYLHLRADPVRVAPEG